MANFRRQLALFVAVLTLSSLTLLVPASVGGAQTASYVKPVEGAPLGEVVVARNGRAYATNRARNQVEVLALASGALEAPIAVGSQPRGLDLSPDENTLYVANSGGNDVSVVDLTLRREVRRLTVPSASNDRPFSLAVANTGRALLTTTFNGSGFGARMLTIDFTTDTVTHRPDFWHYGTTTEVTRMKASGDRSKIGIVAGNISRGRCSCTRPPPTASPGRRTPLRSSSTSRWTPPARGSWSTRGRTCSTATWT